MAGGDILLSKYGKALTLTLNRPERLNVLDNKLIEELIDLIKSYENDENIRVIVLRGAGGKAFCAGTDINYLNGLKSKQEAETFIDSVQGLGFLIESIDKVVIAAIDGYCFGLGNEIAMACDIRVATSTSLFGQPEIKIGVIPGAGGTQRLTQLIGVSKSKELIFTGESIGADEALRLGLVNYVVGKAELESKVDELIGKISANSFNSVKASKRVVNESFHPTGYKIEKQLFVECFEHPDRKEGMDAFLQKRKPNFK